MAIDIILVLVIIWGFYVGYSRGIIKTVFMVLSLVFGIIAAFKFSPAATQFLETAFNNDNPLMLLAGFALSFILTMLLIRLFARGLERLLQTANINFINQVIGGGVMAGFFILVYSMLIWFANSSNIINQQTKSESFSYVYLEKFPDQAKTLAIQLKPVFLDFWDRSVEMMDKLQEMSETEETDPTIYDLDDNNGE